MLALLTYLALVNSAPPAFAAPAGHKAKHDPLNPYEDGRRLSANRDKFKIVLFSDLHYGERGANNSWVDWADKAVSVSSPSSHRPLHIIPALLKLLES